MKALVIGYGSIGKRHAINLLKFGHDVILVRHSSESKASGRFREYFDLEEALTAEKPDFAVVSSPTPSHATDALRLVAHDVPFLLEKPPAIDHASTVCLERAIRSKSFEKYDIAFNMRYYPPLCFIKDYLPRLGKIYAVRVSAGSFLPNWRPGVDYRQTTSAKKELGGGVHIELVHELDYVLWFLGIPSQVVAHVTKVGNLEISSADICVAIMLYPDGSLVELHLDYLSHKNLRGCQIIAEQGTLEWFHSERKIRFYTPASPEASELFSLNPDYDFNQTYIAELKNFIGVLHGVCSPRVDISQAVQIMKVLDALILSSGSRKWINMAES